MTESILSCSSSRIGPFSNIITQANRPATGKSEVTPPTPPPPTRYTAVTRIFRKQALYNTFLNINHRQNSDLPNAPKTVSRRRMIFGGLYGSVFVKNFVAAPTPLDPTLLYSTVV
jgi:hypothetical protein